jgi:tetratricopeptide (TPR) repeat protein
MRELEAGASSGEVFIGRAHELGRLDRACQAARRGRGALVVVTGEPGIGKTRLCDELAERARSAGLRVVAARCWVDGGAPGLWPWQSLLAQLCGPEAAQLLAADTGTATVDPDRFARFAAVTDRIAGACADAPACLVVDDVHAADAGTLLLVRFLARSLRRLPLLVVLAARSGVPDPATPQARVLDDLRAEGLPLVLGQFDREETLAFLDDHGLGGLDPDLSLALYRVTGGHPLFLRRIAALGPPDPDRALPDGLDVAIGEALGRVGPAAADLLRTAAVLGANPSVADTAVICATDVPAVLAAVDEGVRAGLVALDGPGRFSFTHETVRASLEARLDPVARLDAHARAVTVVAVGASPDALARCAHHARIAASRSVTDALIAVSACRSAARAMVDHFAYEQAESLLSAAVAAHPSALLGATPGALVLEWAQAALRCGRMADARQRFDRAAATLRDEGDPVRLAEAALGLGGHWLHEHRAPAERARVLGLQRKALAGLPDDEVALRCRLEARLAAEAVFDGAPVEPVLDALAATRRCGDAVALAEVLSLTHHALFTPVHVRSNLALADELTRVASEAGQGIHTLMGLCWRTVDLFLLGDDRAPRALEELRERAHALANKNILWLVDVIDTMLLLRAGRLADAEAAALRCFESGDAVGEIDALGYGTAQLVGICWVQDRDDEIVDRAREVAASPKLIRAEFSLRASAALVLARTGEHTRARAALADLVRDGLAALPVSSTWHVGLVAIVETADVLGDAGLARQAYELLVPYAELPAIASLAVLCAGSTERTLGVAALTFGDVDRAVGHLERAVDANRRLVNRPMTVLAQASLARALVLRDGPGDLAAALDALEQAIDEAGACEMAGRAAAMRAEATALRARPSSDAGSGPVPGGPGRGVIRREQGRWLVAVDDHRVEVPDRVGMQYLAALLTRPGRAIAALALAGHGDVPDSSSRQELLDETARRSYEVRARHLLAEVEEAEARGQGDRVDRLRTEIEALADQLDAATGLGGRARTFLEPAELARTSVRKAIKRAIDTVADRSPAIGAVLRSGIETGYDCSYTPDPDAPVTWTSSDHRLVDA